MGRRRRRIVKIVKRKMPTVFDCPKCGENSIHVSLLKESRRASVQCGNCGLQDEIDAPKIYESIDVYCAFVDKYNRESGSSV